MTSRAAAAGRIALMALSFVAFLTFSVFTFTRNYAHLAFGIDGSSSFLQAIHAWKWAPVGLGFGPDPFEGMSDSWSGENAFLVPAHVLYALIFGVPTEFTPRYPIVAYTIFAGELFLAVLLLARSLGMSWPVGSIAAWILPLLACPYFGYSLLYPIYMTAPSVGTTVSEATLLLAAISYLGRGWQAGIRGLLRRDLACVLGILCLLVVLVAVYPLRTVLWVPAVAVVALGLVFGANTGERLPKFLMAAACVLIVLGCGALFVFGMFSFTTPRFWSGTLENTINDRSMVSVWFGQPAVGPEGPKLFAFGVFGMATAVAFGSRRLRACAASLLLFVGAVFLLGYIALSGRGWRGPMSLYFEFQIWPFYAVFGVWGVAYWASRAIAGAGWIAGKVGGGRSHRLSGVLRSEGAATIVMVLAAVAVPVFAFGAALSVDSRERLYTFPPSLSPMIQYLRDQIGLTPGAPYRGRVVTMELVDDPKGMDWSDLATHRLGPRYLKSGNDYYSIGFWYYDIPTLFEYNAATSPALFRATTELLARPQDRQLRNVIVWRKPDAHALALLGVRFVIVAEQLPAPFRLVMTEHTYGDEVLSLYEVPGVNLGTDAPTDAVRAAGFDDAVKRIAEPGFDPKHSVVVFDSEVAQEHFSPATSASVRMVRGGFAVDASSAGQALLVLPFEFSHCLDVENTGGAGADRPRLIRVNALETGVLFNKRLSAKIDYFTGLFHNSACRIGDSAEFSRLLGGG